MTQLWTNRIEAQQSPRQTAAGLKAADGLEVTLWANEPDLVNPTNIDIDARGRVWVVEAVNYRLDRNDRSVPENRIAGDRIIILEDADGDGKADKSKVFVQDSSLRSPSGIAVLGNRVVVSQSPDLIIYTKDEQDNVLKKEILLTGWRGIDHDHGLHAVVFGPDGRLYFSNGEQGLDVTDKSGKRVMSSREGPYYAGTALSVNMDGTDLTVVGHNFRNPYELALDSFGNIWQTDTDDGNAPMRLNYVMEKGNFGYWGPGGRNWEADKGTRFHAEIPGIVPNMLRNGSGVPCGLLVYEGNLLPKRYRGHLINADAGSRLINTYYLLPEGAGYSAKREITVASDDMWFRPTDVCVAPDGAVFISDWYDPGVGRYRMADAKRGRIYRLAPVGYRTKRVSLNLETQAGLAEGFASPAQSIRFLAYMKLKMQGQAALSVLRKLANQQDPILRARALWLLGGIPGEGETVVRACLEDADSNFRMLALRIIRLYELDIPGAIRKLYRDPSPQVRREVALTLSEMPTEESLDRIVWLCRKFDERDRWSLESLGIAARGREDVLYPKLREMYSGRWNSQIAKLLWEFHPASCLADMVSYLKAPALSMEQRIQALDVLSAIAKPEASLALAEFFLATDRPNELVEKAFQRLSQQLYGECFDMPKDTTIVNAIRKALGSSHLQSPAVELVEALEDPQFAPDLSNLANSSTTPDEIRGAAAVALGRTRIQSYASNLKNLCQAESTLVRVMSVRGLGYLKPDDLDAYLKDLINSKAPNEVKAESVRILGRTDAGNEILLKLQQSQKLAPVLRAVASCVTNSSPNPLIRARAHKLFPQTTGKDRRALPLARELLSRRGDSERGLKVFSSLSGPNCRSCHSIEESKKSFGPNLSAIGNKLGKPALLDAILNPNESIAPEYDVWDLKSRTDGDIHGIIEWETAHGAAVRTDAMTVYRIKSADIFDRRRSDLSLMPQNLAGTMTIQQFVDLLEFLSSLRGNQQILERAKSQP